ncbi:hypothetical protein [Dictyobacter kobayashii]|uniref:Uncharacterized protein n=1 Tax=Dictyobacter kobayashii TaxID=2014872 RepID=A0A402AP45_9CHLR|nr:hypothetical protein [Dictyobacter kobayashii]GCE20886.1 hypothetical protein KDK_46860 [Dictyobacter kobayashii]
MNTSPFNSTTQSSAEARQHLVDELVSKGAIKTAAIRKAFEAIPASVSSPFSTNETRRKSEWHGHDTMQQLHKTIRRSFIAMVRLLHR